MTGDPSFEDSGPASGQARRPALLNPVFWYAGLGVLAPFGNQIALAIIFTATDNFFNQVRALPVLVMTTAVGPIPCFVLGQYDRATNSAGYIRGDGALYQWTRAFHGHRFPRAAVPWGRRWQAGHGWVAA